MDLSQDIESYEIGRSIILFLILNVSRIHTTSEAQNSDPFSPIKQVSNNDIMRHDSVLSIHYMPSTTLDIYPVTSYNPHNCPVWQDVNLYIQRRNQRLSEVRYLGQRHIASGG